MSRENIIRRFRALVLLQDKESEVYEILDGDLRPRLRVGTCKGDDIVATFDAWADSRERLAVIQGQKSLFWVDGKAFFHMSQVCEPQEQNWDPEDGGYYWDDSGWGDR